MEEFKERYVLQNRFRTLFFAVANNNPMLRRLLIDGLLTAQEFVRMREKDLANDEMKKVYTDRLAYEMQAQRSDAWLEYEMKKQSG